uniref:Uncharacterized protein n=1 Tax=Arundo donax TaxID=35708 RepID=A0A0A8Z4Z4_ARUDO
MTTKVKATVRAQHMCNYSKHVLLDHMVSLK